MVGGPHPSFTELHSKMNWGHHSVSAYLCDAVKEYREMHRLSLKTSLLGKPQTHCFDFDFEPSSVTDTANLSTGQYKPLKRKKPEPGEPVLFHSFPVSGSEVEAFAGKRQPKRFKLFEEVEAAGTEISYRCVRCRGCPDCKKGERIDCISAQEEVEQALIDNSVHVDLENHRTTCRLPFMCDPASRLPPTNEDDARKVYDSQLRQLSKKDPKDKQDVILAEKSLHDLGFVEFLENLTMEQQQKIASSTVKYFIAWRTNWNLNSNTTRCRLVFDASHPTRTGYSLNSLLPKGRNNMNRLVELAIRWQVRTHGFHTDVRKMYNSIGLEEDDWCFQLYWWQDELDSTKAPQVKVIKTAIYGIVSSGNQAERGIRETGNLMCKSYPRVNEVIQKDLYVDDCISGEKSHEARCKTADDLKVVLSSGGFGLKGFTFSGSDPPEELRNPDNSINALGLRWYSKADNLSLNIGELNFGKVRGKKIVEHTWSNT